MPLPLPPDEHPLLHTFVNWQTETLGIPLSFLNGLGTDDDWTVVIKLHAMIEAGLNRLIIGALNEPRLLDLVSKMDTGDRQRGKLAFVKALQLLPDETRNFIRLLSELRNDLVHDVKNFEFSFPKWLETMDKADSKNLRKYVAVILPHDIPFGDEQLGAAVALHRNPRYTMTVACFGIMGNIVKRDLKLPHGTMEP